MSPKTTPPSGGQPIKGQRKKTLCGPGDARSVCAVLRPVKFFITSFLDNKCLSLASSLSYATVLSIVPLLAVAFSITKGLGMYDGPTVRELLLNAAAGREMVVDNILEYIGNTNVKALGTMGAALLLFTAVSLIGTIESAFNGIWQVGKTRGFLNKFTNYLTLIFICPVLIFTAISVTASVESNAAAQWLLGFSLVSQAYNAFLAVLPYLVTWMAFFLVYKFLPNAKTGMKGAAVGAITAGSLWQITQWFYVRYQVGVANYNAIYGGFSQIPLLLAWLYISWAIVLFGAQLAFEVEYYSQRVRELAAANMSRNDQTRLGLLLLLVLTGGMEKRRAPKTAQELAALFQVPIRLVEDILNVFAASRIVATGNAEKGSAPAYLPAAPPDKITLAEVDAILSANRRGQTAPAFVTRFSFMDPLHEELQADPALAGKISLRDLYERFHEEVETNPASAQI